MMKASATVQYINLVYLYPSMSPPGVLIKSTILLRVTMKETVTVQLTLYTTGNLIDVINSKRHALFSTN